MTTPQQITVGALLVSAISAAAVVAVLFFDFGRNKGPDPQTQALLDRLTALESRASEVRVVPEMAADTDFLPVPIFGSDLRDVLPLCLGGDGVTARERDGCRQFFFGQLAGIHGAHSVLGAPVRFCIPPTMSDVELIGGLHRVLLATSDLHMLSAPGAMIAGLEVAIPCTPQGGAPTTVAPDASPVDAQAEPDRAEPETQDATGDETGPTTD